MGAVAAAAGTPITAAGGYYPSPAVAGYYTTGMTAGPSAAAHLQQSAALYAATQQSTSAVSQTAATGASDGRM